MINFLKNGVEVHIFFFPYPSSYHHNLNLFKKTFKNIVPEKVNLDIEMDFTNFHFYFF
jgi:hypothetical protein